ncbi:MAG: four-helix bundle copper-binding protein [Planctomyces sp.]|nr:four-helix bundle copper-binding protein [Planctomyces sp.]
MIGRRQFGTLGLSALGLAAFPSFAAAQARRAASGHDDHLNKALMDCAAACNACQQACDSCAVHCMKQVAEGHEAHLVTAQFCLDCADVCANAARVVSRGGPLSKLICDACAVACDRCAQECEKFPDDEHMKQCAQECRKCEKACKEMVMHLM